jgi:hypothetical protein
VNSASRALAAAALTIALVASGCASLTQLLRARGQVVQLPNPRFLRRSIELAGAGNDEELVIVDIGGGLFFLEPYDPDRTPVLFVHGSGGNPQEFTELIGALDGKRFQPWIAQYPSALRLEEVADTLAYGLESLQEA